MITKPMLAETLEIESVEQLDALPYPVVGTPKLDGIRCLRLNGKTLSRKFLDIPNQHVQKMMANLPDGLDGELMAGENFGQVQTAFMSEDGEPDFRYYVFDYVSATLDEWYMSRLKKLEALSLPTFCIKVTGILLQNKEELIAYEQKCLDEGYEGIMIRTTDSPYKCGRSSLKQAYLLKVKRFKDSECEVIGFEEQLENANEATKDNLGKTKRSKHKANMIPKGTLGKFLVREVGDTPWKGKEFAVGTGEGLTQELRQEIWNNREKYLGKIFTYKYQPHGVKDLPRLPIWKGFRDKRDIS